MAVYTVRYTKSSSFIKEARGLAVNRYDENGNLLSNKDYKLNFLPKVGRNFKVKTRNGKKVVNLSQVELDKLVNEIGFYDDMGVKITEAPLRNPRAKFWKHPQLKVWLEASGTNFNDEIPIDLFWLKVFESDPEFRISTDSYNPALQGKQKYLVTKLGEDVTEKTKKVDEVLEAMQIMSKMSFDKKVTILRAMGVDLRNPDQDAVDRALAVKITDMKDMLGPTGERFIELFLRLSKENPKDLNIQSYIRQARSMRRITKKNDGYFYGEIFLGRVLEDVSKFLSDEDNEDVLNRIIRDINNN